MIAYEYDAARYYAIDNRRPPGNDRRMAWLRVPIGNDRCVPLMVWLRVCDLLRACGGTQSRWEHVLRQMWDYQ